MKIILRTEDIISLVNKTIGTTLGTTFSLLHVVQDINGHEIMLTDKEVPAPQKSESVKRGRPAKAQAVPTSEEEPYDDPSVIEAEAVEPIVNIVDDIKEKMATSEIKDFEEEQEMSTSDIMDEITDPALKKEIEDVEEAPVGTKRTRLMPDPVNEEIKRVRPNRLFK